jgi:hypothetical protein
MVVGFLKLIVEFCIEVITTAVVHSNISNDYLISLTAVLQQDCGLTYSVCPKTIHLHHPFGVQSNIRQNNYYVLNIHNGRLKVTCHMSPRAYSQQCSMLNIYETQR